MKKLAILGASYLQVPLIKKAKEMGIETHCFAWEEGAIGKGIADFFYPISIIDKEAILLKSLEIGIDGITTIASDLAVPTMCYVSDKMNLISNSFESSLICTNKFLMRSRLTESGVSYPKFIELSLENDFSLDNSFFKHTSFPYIVKPVDRSGSRGVKKIENIDELHNAISIACAESFLEKCIIEEFIEGVEVSVETISWKGEHFVLAITDKVTTGAPFFVELAHHQPSGLDEFIQNKIEEATLKCLSTLDIKNGPSHSEFKITKNGTIFIIEVGARMGGDFIGSNLVELSTGYDFLKSNISLVLGNFEKPIKKFQKYAGVHFLSKETEKKIFFFEENIEFEIEKKIFNLDLKYVANSNERSGYFIYQSDKRI
jgi:biotin carboxylase